MSASNEEFDQRVRERAYAMWEEAGRPEGRAEEFWERARQELGDTQTAAAEETEEQDADEDVRDAGA